MSPGGVIEMSATVQSGCLPFEICPPFSGTVSWDDGDSGGSFDIPSCTFGPTNESIETCTTLYHAATVTGVALVVASYSGDSVHSPSAGNSMVVISTNSTTQSTSGTTTGSGAAVQSGPLGASAIYLLVAGLVVVVVAASAIYFRRRKPL